MLRKLLQNASIVAWKYPGGNCRFGFVSTNVKHVQPSLSGHHPIAYCHRRAAYYSTVSKPLREKTSQGEEKEEGGKSEGKEAETKNVESESRTKADSENKEEFSQNSEEEPTYKDKDRKEEYRKRYTVNTAIINRTFFEDMKKKNKETFLASVDVFVQRDKYLRGHVEFIYSAMKHMKEFGVHKDLAAYKKLLDVFPKGKMVARSVWQVEFVHYPKQQYCAVDLLEQMEDNGVLGDSEIEDMLANIFGPTSWPSRKHWRMMYWMPKFKNLSPWYLPDPLPDDSLELVKLAIQRITSVDPATRITIYRAEDLEDASDPTWIVSGQSPDQISLIEAHAADRPIYVEGAFRVWLRDQCINYFILRAEPKPKVEVEHDEDDVGDVKHVYDENYGKELVPKSSVHEQEDGTILAVCATGTSSRDSVVSWIRFLQDTNPRLGKDISVVFTLKSPVGPTDNLDPTTISQSEQEAISADDKDRGLFGGTLGYDSTDSDLSQWGIGRFSDTRFVNWPHHFNRKLEYQDEPTERLSDSEKRNEPRIDGSKDNTNKKLS